MGWVKNRLPGEDGEDLIRVVLIEKSVMFREAICRLAQDTEDIRIVGGASAVSEWEGPSADVAVVDPGPGVDGEELVGVLSAASRVANTVILLSAEVPSQARRHLGYDLHGLVFKGSGAAMLLASIRAAAGNGVFLDPAASSCLSAPSPEKPWLRSEESRLLEAVRAGLTNLEIGEKLGLALPAVKSRLHRLFRKLGVRNRVELVRLYDAVS